jgi:serine protease
MRGPRWVCGAVAATALVLGPMTSASAGDAISLAPVLGAGSAQAVPDSYIVVLRDTATAADVESTIAAAAAAGGTVEHNLRTINGFTGHLPVGALDVVRRAAGVRYVEQDTRASLDLPTAPGSVQDHTTVWGLDRIDQRDLPINRRYHYNDTGRGVTAYVIDTGIRVTHAQFDGRASSGYDFVDDDDDASDCHGHGTHMAGTLGGATYGVAKKVGLVAVRTIDCNGFGDVSDTIAGVDWVIDNAVGPSLITMSVRFNANQTLDDLVKAAFDADIPSAVAAGNFDQSACDESPMREPTANTVAATTSVDSEADFSNDGPCVDIYAPGVGVLSAWNTSDTAIEVLDGTSTASAHVAGAIALLLDKQPHLTAAQVSKLLAQRCTRDRISDLGPGSPNCLLFTKKY